MIPLVSIGQGDSQRDYYAADFMARPKPNAKRVPLWLIIGILAGALVVLPFAFLGCDHDDLFPSPFALQMPAFPRAGRLVADGSGVPAVSPPTPRGAGPSSLRMDPAGNGNADSPAASGRDLTSSLPDLKRSGRVISAAARLATERPRERTVSSSRPADLFVVTAYDSCYFCTSKRPGHPAYGITKSGLPVTANGGKICAVDPRVIPLGTYLRIPGYGVALACDTGGAIKGNRIDLYYPTHAEALRFGRQTLTVERN